MTNPSAGPRTFRSWSLKTRIALFTLAIFVASFWTLALYVGQLLQRDMQQLLTDQQFAAVSLVADQINGDVEERMSSLQTIARVFTPAVIADAAALQADLERQAVLNRLFNRGIFVTDANGNVIASTPLSAGRTGLNLMDKEHVVTTLKQGKANIGRPTVGKTLGAPVIVMAVPIWDAQDRVIGALMGATDLGAPSFLDKIADNRFGKTGGYLLVAPQYRQIITAGDKRRTMEIMPPPGKIPLIDLFIEGYEGAGIFINPLGVEVLTAAKSIPSAGWYVAVTLPTAEAFAPVDALENRLLQAALLATLLVGMLTWWMVQRQLKPMLVAIETLENLSNAELPIRLLPVKRQDEVGQLINSFNRLLQALAEREAASKEAQNLLGRIASRVPGMVYQFRLRADGTSCFPYASAGIRSIYRVEPEVVREDASKAFAVLHPDDYDAVAASIGQSAERLTLWLHEYRVKFVDGTVRWLQGNAMPQREDDGAVIWHGFITDITERKQIEREAQIQRDFAAQIISAMGQGLIVTSPSGVLEFANPALASLLGYTTSELIGKGRNEIFFEEEATRQPQILADREAGISSTYDARFRRLDGTSVPVQVTGVPRFVDGKYAGSIAVITDLSDRVRAEQALQDSEQRFRMLIELSPEASVVHSGGMVLYANPAALALYGAGSAQEVIGKSLLDFVHPESRAEVIARLAKLAAGAATLPMLQSRNITIDGVVIEVESQNTATVFDGKPAVRLSIRDVTARNRANAERALLEEQLRESQKMQAIGTLAGGIAHDFNNILAAILGNSELAREDSAGNKRALESIDEIRKAATRARDLVKQILSFSRRQPTERKQIKLDAVIEEARRLLRATLPMRLSLEVRCDQGVPEVLADATQIQQAIINLATNAMQAMASGPGRIEIRLEMVAVDPILLATHPKLQAMAKPDLGHASHPGHALRLTVRDSGPGIPPETLQRIFEPFFTTKPVNEGTGLGLSVVHGIVDAHEGVIGVTSTVGVGTSFDIYLPIATASGIFQPSALPTFTGSNLAIKNATGLRILYLDDDEAIVFLTSRLLGRRGFRVAPFNNQQDALDALRATPNAFDVVVTDYNMPGMSGIDVANEVRAIRMNLPVIIASGFVDEELQKNAVAAGVRSVVFKATIVDEFVNAIAKAVEPA